MVQLGERLHTEETQQAVGGAVEEPDERRHDVREPHERAHDEATDALRRRERQGFRRELAQHYVQERDDRERNDDRRVEVLGSLGQRNPRSNEHAIHDRRQSGLADPAEREGRDCDAELRAGDVTVEMRERRKDVLRCPVALLDHLLDLRPARRDQRELGGDHEAVHEHEHHDRPESEGDVGGAEGVAGECQQEGGVHR